MHDSAMHDSYHLYRAHWSRAPMVYIAGRDRNIDRNECVGGLIERERELRKRVGGGGKRRWGDITIKVNHREVL